MAQHSNKGKKYRQKDFSRASNKDLFNKIRERLKLTEEQLSDKTIKKVLKLNFQLIGDWIINNPDGFKIKDNGILCVSKWLPKCLRGDKEQKIEEILNNPKNDAYMKDMFIKRYNKSLEYYKSRKEKGKYHINLHSFFYLYRIIWFNSRNTAFKKAELYEFIPNKDLKNNLAKKIIEGKDYYEYQFSDFRLRKRDKMLSDAEKLEKQRIKRKYSRRKKSTNE